MKKLAVLFILLGLLVGLTGSYAAEAAAATTKKVPPKAKKAAKTTKATQITTPESFTQPVGTKPALTTTLPLLPAASPEAKPLPVQKQRGILSLGVNADLTGSYMHDNQGVLGTVAARINIILKDSLSLGPRLGLTAEAVTYKLGVGSVYGKDINRNNIKALPLYFDAVVNLPSKKVIGADAYVGGGLNYVVYGSGQIAGTYGGQIYAGLWIDLDMGLGLTGLEIGYGVVRANGAIPTLSAKGVTIALTQPLSL